MSMTLRRAPTAAAVAVIGLAVASVRAESEPGWQAPALALIEPTRQRELFPGLAIGLVVDGRPELAAGTGTLAPGGGEPVSGATRFRLASLSKLFTAVAVFRLAERRELELDGPARRYCPAFSPPNGDPTLRQLLSHHGGVRHFSDEEDTSIRGDVARLEETVARFGGEKLRFPPGEQSGYTSAGYVVLGCALERASGLPFFDLVRREVLDPAGIPGVLRDAPDLDPARVAPGFQRAGKKLKPSLVVDTRFKTPASGFDASADEVARFVAALLDGRLLAPTSLDAMFAPVKGAAEKEATFTSGWMVATNRSRGPAFYMTGSMEGATALLYVVPGHRFALVLLGNRERAVPELVPAIEPLTRLVLGEPGA